MIDCFLAMDFGTQGVRVSLITKQGKLIGSFNNNYPICFPKPGLAEQDPNEWEKSLKEALHALFKFVDINTIHILSCSVSTTSSTVFPIDKNGKALSNALMWMDCRSTGEADIINSKNYEIVKYSGGEVSTEWLIPKVLWFKKNRPKLYSTAYRFIEELDYINYLLTGNLVCSFCNATCKANYVQDLGGWNDDYFNSIGLSEYKDKINTDVLKVGGEVGFIKDSFCNLYGIDYKIPVFQGCIDAYSGMIGLGVVKPGKLATIMGTSFVELCLGENTVFQKGLWGPYKDALIDGYSVYEGGQVSAGSIAKWYKNLFGCDSEINFDTLSKEAMESGIGSNGVLALDFFQGNRTPYKNTKVRGEIKNLSLSSSRGDIYRALLESVAFGTKNTINHMSMTQREIDGFVASGGVTKDELWMEIIADVCGMPISLVDSRTYSGLMGSSLISAVSLGIYSNYEQASNKMINEVSVIEPNLRNTEKYKPIYEKYLHECNLALEKG
jgi:FGGY-family pentulose kinase